MTTSDSKSSDLKMEDNFSVPVMDGDDYTTIDKFLEKIDFKPMQYEKGKIVGGKIVKMKKGEALVDVGGKAEGIISGRELRSEEGLEEDLKAGENVLVYVVNPENDKGQMELSIRRTGTAKKWHKLFQAQDKGDIIEVTVLESNTGGVIVDVISGLRGFIPTSQLDPSRIFIDGYRDKRDAATSMQKRLASLIGEKVKVKVIEIDRDKNRVILSEKLVTSGQDIEQREETLKRSKVEDILEGEVTGIAPFGLFVNAQGLEGLVHLSEISWDKVSNPADFYKVGEKAKVQIIGIEDGGKRIAYSIKRLQPDPWAEAISKYKIGQMVKGKVQKIVNYGAFVRIAEGLNGLIHISELSNDLILDPKEVVNVGDELDLQIISISPTERHLGLSLRRVKSEKGKEKEGKGKKRPTKKKTEK